MSLVLWNRSRIIKGVKALIYEKLANIQQELKVGKTQRNTFGGYNFRNCSDILEAVKPLLKKYKCLILLSDEINFIGESNYVKSTATIIDCEDNQTLFNTAYAREPESLKGQSPAQITGGSSSYARKYALSGLLAIDDSKDDPDNRDNTKEEEKPKTRRSRRTSRITKEELENVPF